MKFAIIQLGKSQYKVSEGEILKIDRLIINKKPLLKGEHLDINQVLLVAEDDKISIGKPILKNIKVKLDILAEGKGEKVRVATYKAKSRYRKVKGFRPIFTEVKVNKISTVK